MVDSSNIIETIGAINDSPGFLNQKVIDKDKDKLNIKILRNLLDVNNDNK